MPKKQVQIWGQMIFLTGATGFLGGQVLARILSEQPHEKILVLIRAKGQFEAEQRLRTLLHDAFPHSNLQPLLSRIQPVCGDLSLADYGLGAAAFKRLSEKVTAVIHCAAATALEQSLETARTCNVAGTLNTLQFATHAAASQNQKVKFVHTSTAYVAGDTEQTVDAARLSLDVPFRNSYERSKAEAEMLVQQHKELLSTVVFRPSVIVGDSITGHTSAFNVIYVPTKLIAMGLLSAFPAMPNAPCDVVPVDYVARALADSIRQDIESGSSFHLCAGVGRESSPREIMEQIIKICNDHCPLGLRRLTPPFVSPELVLSVCNSFINATTRVKSLEKFLSLPTRLILQLLPFIPYMTRNPRFDISSTVHTLGMSPPPLFKHYAELLFRFCLETNWGKVPHRPGAINRTSLVEA